MSARTLTCHKKLIRHTVWGLFDFWYHIQHDKIWHIIHVNSCLSYPKQNITAAE